MARPKGASDGDFTRLTPLDDSSERQTARARDVDARASHSSDLLRDQGFDDRLSG